MNTTMNTNDKFNRSTADSKTNIADNKTDIANNKIEVTLDRFRNLKATDVARVLKTLATIIETADNHEAGGDQYFDYSQDRIQAYTRINMLVSLIYKKEGNLDEIMKDVCYKNSRALSEELLDHYWAF